MMMGSVSVAPGADAFAVARLLSNIAMLVDGPAVAAQLRELADAMQRHNAAIAEIAEREKQLVHRGRELDAAAEALAKAQADLTEREKRAHAELQRVEEKKAEFAAMKAEVKQMLAA
jgi:hypothetical protein